MAEQHPVQGLMYTAMQSIKEMIDVNTIVGDPVETSDGTVLIPISKMSVGFGVGGSDHSASKLPADKPAMFGGGVAGGVTIAPVAFMVVGKGQIRLIPVNPESTVYDRIFDMIPVAIDKIAELKDSLSSKKSKQKGAVVRLDDEAETVADED